MRFLSRALVFIAAALVCAAASNAIAGPERRLKWFAFTESTANPPASTSTAAPPAAASAARADFAPHPDKPWVEISGEDVAALHARGPGPGAIPFLDARRTSVYRDGHIAGALPYSVWEADIDDKVKAFYGEGHDAAAPIVVYCSGGDCEDSHMLGQKLFFAGFNNVLVYKDGFPDWQKRGLAVTKGEKP